MTSAADSKNNVGSKLSYNAIITNRIMDSINEKYRINLFQVKLYASVHYMVSKIGGLKICTILMWVKKTSLKER